MRYRHVVVDGIRTAYLEEGAGPAVVLLHSGEFGASAELSWEATIPALAQSYRVVAPDWLGFGGTDKVYDFAGGRARRIAHMRRFLQVMDIDSAAFIGSSMGGTVLASVAADDPGFFPAEALVLSSGGGFAPDNAARRALLDYDCTLESMRNIVRTIFHDDSWASHEAYVKRRHESSLVPGAWEATSAPRFKPPTAPTRSAFGQPDETPYEMITVPTLVVGGENDPLRLEGYVDEIVERLPRGWGEVYAECAHVPHLEHPDRFNRDVLAFLDREYRSNGGQD